MHDYLKCVLHQPHLRSKEKALFHTNRYVCAIFIIIIIKSILCTYKFFYNKNAGSVFSFSLQSDSSTHLT